jgi:GDP-mannose 6-dehydrogenase
MKLSVFGLGYVGCVSAACFADTGNSVIGVDINPVKIDIINSGNSPIVEPGMSELIKRAVESGKLRATTDSNQAINESDISLVCVGTPSRLNGALDLSHVEKVCDEIGRSLRDKKTDHTIVVRSTMLPGTIERVVTPILEAGSGKKVGAGLTICINPEFLREGSSIKDFYSPPFTLIGADDEAAGKLVGSLYAGIEAPLMITSVKTAEMVKYVCNCFHALKVSFANEIGNICKAAGVDSHEVMDIFCEDRKLNLSPYYLKPGFAFGGSCLPKDLRAITYQARLLEVEAPLLSAILPSNRLQVERAMGMIQRTGKKKIGILGFSFKAGTDDLRESPMVTLVEWLIGKGYDVQIYDRDVSLARLFGANKEYIEKEIPHIAQLLRDDLSEVVAQTEVIVIGNKSPEFGEIRDQVKPEHVIIDLVRMFSEPLPQATYEGICW